METDTAATRRKTKIARPVPADPATDASPAAPAVSPASPSSVADAMTNRQLVFWMFGFLKPVKPLVFVACLYLALWVGAEVMAVRQSGEAVNHIRHLQTDVEATGQGFRSWVFSSQPDAIKLRAIVFTLAGFVALMALLRYLREVAQVKLSMTMVFYIREAIYDKLQRVGFGFHDALSSGQLINRALTDLQNVRSFIQTAVLTSLEIVLIVGGYIALLLTRNPWVALLSLVPLPIWTWYIVRFGQKVQPASKAVMEAEDKNVSIITENIAGVHVVKAFATEKQEIGKYNGNAETYYERLLTRIRMFADFTPVVRAIATASYLSLFLAAGIFMIKGKLDAGDFIILGSAMGAILTRLQQVSTINEQYQNAIVSARRFYEVLMAPQTVPEKPHAKALPPGPGAVKFENVSFGYTPEKHVLHDVSFEAKGGSIVAIVGPTGAGKTTLVNLISRFYDAQSGRILIDGHDLKDLSLASVRSEVGFVFQETYLFSDTVTANIAYGRPHIREGEVEAAARLAQAHEFIEQLPKGYDTILGERGASLSGGQRQRLAIARAILTNPRVLVLDDATAAVDPETEDMIRKGMTFVMRGRTTFVIAHRISTVKRANLVLVLENGRVTQAGTHKQLMEEEGHYREIAAVQLQADDVPGKPRDHSERPSHMDRVRSEQHVGQAVENVARQELDNDMPVGK